MVISGFCIAVAIIRLIAYYDLFVSADPKNATLYFVFGLFGGFMGMDILMPAFVFAVRHKDYGMPPRGGVILNGEVVWDTKEQM